MVKSLTNVGKNPMSKNCSSNVIFLVTDTENLSERLSLSLEESQYWLVFYDLPANIQLAFYFNPM